MLTELQLEDMYARVSMHAAVITELVRHVEELEARLQAQFIELGTRITDLEFKERK